MKHLVAACLGLLAFPVLAIEPVVLRGGFSELVFKTSTTPISWTVCERRCDDPTARRATLFAENDGGFSNADRLTGIAIEPLPDSVEIRVSGAEGTWRYRLFDGSARVELAVPEGGDVSLSTGSVFVPEQLPGFGQIYSRVSPVSVDADGQRNLSDQVEESGAVTAEAGDGVWTGIRNRYWAILLQPKEIRAIELSMPVKDRPAVSIPGGGEYRLYAGPVEWQSLQQVSPELSEMLFAALWNVLRALTFGMMMLYGLILGVVGNHGLAVILLSLTVKILMTPLTALADRWQRDVNETHSLLKPELDAIKREFKGEEAHTRTLDVYRKHNISQFYTFKSAAGFLIQIPVFIAAFDMLAENFALSEIGFLWITDLAKPDSFAALPLVLPFFGAYLNLLPFLMTFLSALAALLQSEDSLSADLQRQQSIRLYLMSAAFFVLFYTFPAGMVLYWTSSNLFHLLKVESGRLFMRK